MELLDSRRLTGPNLLWEKPGAVLDIRFDDEDVETVIRDWELQARRILDALGWDQESTRVRRFPNGASLAISAPRDVLYAATEINEWAWDAACTVAGGKRQPDLEPTLEQLWNTVEDEINPPLRALLLEAKRRNIPTLSDDDCLSLGLGKGSHCYPVDALPEPAAIPWQDLHAIPVGLITGTNGKTTSVRLAARIARGAGFHAGVSSTDWIAVDDDILDRGDYSGPGGARSVLRDPRVDLAVLETARGGLLRRGLGLDQASAALITNVASDHLGEFGVETLQELADVKWIVTRALRHGGRLVLNAADPLLVERARRWPQPITWFSTDPEAPALLEGLRTPGNAACTIREGELVWMAEGETTPIVAVNEVPITLEGAATYNICNALGVIGLCVALGISLADIAAGLRLMQPADNPGRANLYRIGGARVIADFAHNPHGMQALLELGRNMPAKRRLLVTGQAGDRSDEDIRQLVDAAVGLDLDRVIIKRMEKYNRGRADGEVAAMMRQRFLELGVDADRIHECNEEMDAITEALRWAQPGDLVLLPIHEDREAALAYLQARQKDS